MLAFWIWALVLAGSAPWPTGNAGGNSSEPERWRSGRAGQIRAITLLPLCPLGILRTRKLVVAAGRAVPWIMVAAYEWITPECMEGLLSVASGFAQSARLQVVGRRLAREIVGLVCRRLLLPCCALRPWLWPWRTLLKGGAVIFGALLALVWLGGDLGLFTPLTNSDAFNHWAFGCK